MNLTNYRSTFDLLADACKKAGVSYILVGGFAVNYHKYTRATNDIDFMMTDEDFEKIRPSLEKAGYRLETKQSLCARLAWPTTDTVEKDGFFIDLDILFVEPQTLQRTLNESAETTVLGTKTRVVSLNHLMTMKLHSLKNGGPRREDPDLTDLVRLVQNNKVDVKTASFRDLCLKFGNAELYDQIVEKVRLWKN